MSRERRAKRHSGAKKQNNAEEQTTTQKSRGQQKPKQFRPPKAVTQDQIKEEEDAILAFKNGNQVKCARCHEPIIDLSSAVQDRELQKPIHFDCALEQITNAERLSASEKIAYIGQGRFGIISYANPRDIKHFSIKKIIEWEDRENPPAWRSEMAELYSKIR